MNDYLKHYGVLGMKWGVRRYQNTDGSYTAAGKQRYSSKQSLGGSSSNDSYKRTKQIKEVVDEASKANKNLNEIGKRKRVSNKPMDLSSKSDSELRNEINRYYLEKQYREVVSAKNTTKGMAYAKNILSLTGDALAITSSALGIMLAIKKLQAMSHSEMFELMHHGILGMKWGQRNGPPYPLGTSDHSAAEVKADWKKSLGGSTGSSNSGSSEERTRPNKTSSGKNIDKNTGFHKLSKQETADERLERCNPNYRDSKEVTPYNRNCGNTVIADELRKRGLDVEARGNNIGLTVKNVQNFFKNSEENTNSFDLNVKNLKGKVVRKALFGGDMNDKKTLEYLHARGDEVQSQFSEHLKSVYPEGSRGCMSIVGLFGSHWISWEYNNGQIEFSNPQNKNEDLKKAFGLCVNNPANKTTAIRLDNLSSTNDIGNVVMNYGDSKTDAKGMSFNPLTAQGEEFIKANPNIEKAVEAYFGPMWDGSWDSFDPRTKQLKLKELR